MLKMIKGASINDFEKLNEEFAFQDNSLIANINADKILKIMNEFVDIQEKSLFLIIEVPTHKDYEDVKGNIIEKFHKDIYYIDNMSNERVKELLKKYGNLFINDGSAQIGVGNHITHAEIMANKYNVVTIFSGKDDGSKYEKLMINNKIQKVDNLVTAWDFFSETNFGECIKIEEDGKDVYDAIKELEKSGLYFAERRED